MVDDSRSRPAPDGVRTGLARVAADPGLLGDRPWAFVTNYTAVLPDLTRGVDALVAAGVPIRSLITPEHGFWGAVQAGESESAGGYRAGETELPVYDAYLQQGAALVDLLRAAVPDGGGLLYDLTDIGARFYTYVWSLYDLMCAAATAGIPVTVLDRPNPLGGERRFGPGLDPACASFVGRVSVPLQHGLTVGELARLFAAVRVPEATGRPVEVEVIEVEGWSRSMAAAATGLPWVLPSPNIATPDAAVLYPATCLLEGTVASEGRGTTRPFELLGAPWLDERFATALIERDLPGVGIREQVFRPMFSKAADQPVRGVQLHLLDRTAFDPVRTGVTLLQVLADLAGDRDLWRPRPADQSDRPPFIDLLWGSPALRQGIDAGDDLDAILAASPTADHYPDGTRLYA